MVWREVFRAWHLRQRRIHRQAEMSMPIHQKKRASMLTVRGTPKWQEAVAWQVCSTQGRINIGTWMRGGGAVEDVQLVPVLWGKWLSHQENDVVVGAVELAFSCEGKHVWKRRAPGKLE